MGSLPATATASLCSGTPAWLQTAANSATGWSTPVSWLPSITLTTRVCGPSSGASRSTQTTPSPVDAERIEPEALFQEVFGRSDDAGVLDGRDDDLSGGSAGTGDAQDGQVIGLGAAGW